MKLSRRRKNAKRVIYTRRTKYHCKKYKNKQTYRKHSHKLKKNKRVMRGGDGETGETGQPVQQTKLYEFTFDESISAYKSSGDLTYKRGDSVFTGTKTKDFNMELKYDDASLGEQKKTGYILLSRTGERGTSYDSELYDLCKIHRLKSETVYRQVFAVFKLEMKSTDVKHTKFTVYFKVDIANAYDANGNAYLKAFITYSLDTNFNTGPIIETPFMRVADSPVLVGICPLFKNAGLVIPDQGTNDKSDICYFSCKDNSDFFWKLTYTMVKTATDIELKKIQSAH